VFTDPELRALIQSALTYNIDFQKSTAKLAEALALYDIQDSACFPTLLLGAEVHLVIDAIP